MNELLKLLHHNAYINEGIVPMHLGMSARDMNEVLANLPQDEALRMKRKFRKVWKKALKWKKMRSKYAWSKKHFDTRSNANSQCAPNKSQKLYRKQIVMEYIFQERISHVLTQIKKQD